MHSWRRTQKTRSVIQWLEINLDWHLPINLNMAGARVASATSSLKNWESVNAFMRKSTMPNGSCPNTSVTILSLTHPLSLRMTSMMVCSRCLTEELFQETLIYRQLSKELVLLSNLTGLESTKSIRKSRLTYQKWWVTQSTIWKRPLLKFWPSPPLMPLFWLKWVAEGILLSTWIESLCRRKSLWRATTANVNVRAPRLPHPIIDWQVVL